jgi:hypothetical protein
LKFRSLALLLAFALLSGAAIAADADDSTTASILDRYVANTQNQASKLRGLQMTIEIDAQLPKLKKSGTMHALRTISRLGQITYKGLRFIGDNTVKKDVIARYLTAEKESREVSQLAVTPTNYKFKYKGLVDRDGRLVHVFQLKPKKKMVGLFSGELWLDPETCLPVRESGKFVKNPSIFLKKVEFVREYEIRDGVALPHHIESRVRTRFWGPALVSINYSNIEPSREEQISALPTHDGQ